MLLLLLVVVVEEEEEDDDDDDEANVIEGDGESEWLCVERELIAIGEEFAVYTDDFDASVYI